MPVNPQSSTKVYCPIVRWYSWGQIPPWKSHTSMLTSLLTSTGEMLVSHFPGEGGALGLSAVLVCTTSLTSWLFIKLFWFYLIMFFKMIHHPFPSTRDLSWACLFLDSVCIILSFSGATSLRTETLLPSTLFSLLQDPQTSVSTRWIMGALLSCSCRAHFLSFLSASPQLQREAELCSKPLHEEISPKSLLCPKEDFL